MFFQHFSYIELQEIVALLLRARDGHAIYRRRRCRRAIELLRGKLSVCKLRLDWVEDVDTILGLCKCVVYARKHRISLGQFCVLVEKYAPSLLREEEEACIFAEETDEEAKEEAEEAEEAEEEEAQETEGDYCKEKTYYDVSCVDPPKRKRCKGRQSNAEKLSLLLDNILEITDDEIRFAIRLISKEYEELEEAEEEEEKAAEEEEEAAEEEEKAAEGLEEEE